MQADIDFDSNVLFFLSLFGGLDLDFIVSYQEQYGLASELSVEGSLSRWVTKIFKSILDILSLFTV